MAFEELKEIKVFPRYVHIEYLAQIENDEPSRDDGQPSDTTLESVANLSSVEGLGATCVAVPV